MSDEFDLAIIGAGAAGISAARTAAAAGLRPLVLEAAGRVGGRAWTVEVAGYPVDLGCGWLHSADRNPWTAIARASARDLDKRASAWNRQYLDLGFPPEEQAAADEAFRAWQEQLRDVAKGSDRASDALEPGGPWNAYIDALCGFISGTASENLSARDYLAYDEASTYQNWRVPSGYGRLIAASLPDRADIRLSTPVSAVDVGAGSVSIATPGGTIRASTAIMTVSTAVLAGDMIRVPHALEPWREAAACLPLGLDEKLYLEIDGAAPFEDETHLLGNPRDRCTGSYYIRPFGRPVIECYLGGDGAGIVSENGKEAAFAFAMEELARLFGGDIRKRLKPVAASDWRRTGTIGGAYSYALPGRAEQRKILATSFRDRLFFAGEATEASDFSTAHGAFQSGERAAREAIAALDRLGHRSRRRG